MASAPPAPIVRSGQNHSSQERSLVPVGMATILPEAAQQVRRLEAQLLGQIRQWGYDEIILPTFEYLDVLAPGLESAIIEQCYKFPDRTTGRILLLRPDATAQIARTVAMGMMGSRLPLRLSYRATVFRYEPEHAGRDREIFQVGAELIGADDVTADSEIISLLIECLRQVGLGSFKISLGHVGFFKGLLVRAGLSPNGQKRAEQAAARKDLPWLQEILAQERVAKMYARAILEAPELCGQAEVLARGRALAGGEKSLLAALDRLTQVYQLLCAAGYQDALLLDLGEFRGFDYYDGVVFDVFAEGIGVELGGGGRYDHLIGRFGRDIPSTGFALNVDRLFRGLSLSSRKSEGTDATDIFLAASPASARKLLPLAGLLRRAGKRVVQQICAVPAKRLIDAAVEAGLQHHAHAVVVLGSGVTRSDDLLVVHVSTAQGFHNGRPRLHKKVMSIRDLVGSLSGRRDEAEGDR
jgi:ATP phosphoribosyltransferase regulatory subunit